MQRVFLAAFFMLFARAATAEDNDKPVFFCSAVPSQDFASNIKRFSQFVVYLEAKLGVPVRYAPTTSYEATVEAFAQRDIHLGWFGAFTGIQARLLSPGAEAIAQGAEDLNFKSYFIANSGANLSRASDFPASLKGKSFTFGSNVSTSGRLMPEYFIRKHFMGMPLSQIFSRVGFSGDHVSTLRAVQSGEYDAGALDFKVFEAESKAGRVDDKKVRVIWETPPYPDYQFTIQGGLDQTFGPGFKDKVRQAILDLNDKDILSQFGRSRFIPASNDQYRQIEEVLRQKPSNLQTAPVTASKQ